MLFVHYKLLFLNLKFGNWLALHILAVDFRGLIFDHLVCPLPRDLGTMSELTSHSSER